MARTFLDDVADFRALLGTKAFWAQSEDRRAHAVSCLGFSYLKTPDHDERDATAFAAAVLEYERRGWYMGTSSAG